MKNLIKHYCCLLILGLYGTLASAQQNMVPNGGFESYITCPTGFSQLTGYVSQWYNYNTLSSPDYFNSCHLDTQKVSAPKNGWGYQVPLNGQAYGGGFINEYIATEISPLTPGTAYEVCMSVSLADVMGLGSNGLSIYFFYSPTPQPTVSAPSPSRIFLNPQVSYSSYGPITDKINWVRLKKIYIPDSFYNHIVIGTFFQDSLLMKVPAGSAPSSLPTGIYYYIDSVVIKIADKASIDIEDTISCAGDSLVLPYTVNQPGYFNSNNVFTIQLSDPVGNFPAPINIGTVMSFASGVIRCRVPPTITTASANYRLRIVSSSPLDSSQGYNVIGIGTGLAKPVISSNSPVCLNESINLTATSNISNPALKWIWSGPNGFISTQQNPVRTDLNVSYQGNYIVTSSLYGCSMKDTENVILKSIPSPIIATSNSPVCVNDTLKLFSTNSSSGTAYSWTGPNSFTASSQNTSITHPVIAAVGDYIVAATLNGCSVKDTVTVLIKPTPANFSASDNSPVCVGGIYNMNATTTSTGVTWNWTGPFSFSSTTQNTALTGVTASNVGDYIITATLNGCSIKDTVTLVVNPLPVKPVASSNTPVCSGNTLNLISSTSTSGVSYSWTGPNGFSSAAQNPTRNNIGIADAGTYSVIATLNGCTSVAGSTAVVVNPAPFVTIYSNPADSICQGSPVTFVALPANTSTPTYRWTKNSSPTVLGTSNTFISTGINNNDIIRCEITETQKCGVPFTDTSNEIKMTVLSWVTPSVSITANPSTPLSPNQLISFTATPINGGSKPQYQWTRNGTNVIGANAAGWSTQQLSNNDMICVNLTSSEKCPQPKTVQSNCITVTVLTDVDNIKTIGNLTLYPNPNNGSFTIKGSVNSNETITLQILNATGQLVYETRMLPKNKELCEQVDVQHLPGGVYTLRLNGITNIRFTIE